MDALTIAVARARQAELLAAASADRCCGRGALVRHRRRQRLRSLLGR